MKIERITYERLQTVGRFNNVKVGATAIVEPDENPNDAWKKLARYVHAKLRLAGKIDAVIVHDSRQSGLINDDDPPF